MNKVILMGRLVRDPEIKYTTANEPLAVARYTLAVDRKFKRQGEPEADFISCVAFGKSAVFIEKYVKKGQRIAVAGALSTRTWEDRDGKKHYATEVVTNEHYFADGAKGAAKEETKNDGFYPIDGTEADDDLPF